MILIFRKGLNPLEIGSRILTFSVRMTWPRPSVLIPSKSGLGFLQGTDPDQQRVLRLNPLEIGSRILTLVDVDYDSALKS